VLYYAAQIFERAGFAGGQEAAGVSVLLGAFKLVMTLVAVATVDKLGRRPLLLGGVSGMVVALLLLTAAQGGVEVAAAAGGAAGAGGGGVSAAWVSAAALLLYVGCYQVSFGPISWLIVGEVFPLAVSGWVRRAGRLARRCSRGSTRPCVAPRADATTRTHHANTARRYAARRSRWLHLSTLRATRA
jgi:hypothetical protein